MDALIDLSLRAVFLALLHPFTRGLLFVLVALYGAGSGWPGWVSGLCGGLGVGFWLAPLWGLWRDRRR
ncbi:hypothetical protein DAERI_100130 [Deinococcus aerius]|uniref:Uncharacterized protein n=1 Tax=Deinococcus aerius TaxID=200253 RepID=A0A2I9DV94_9DEIO|nr:hypothetical protein [Deinococcus aerius]GBF06767.1 hypothetical protein DAERI_100130 [Deinococcus aerius]